MRNPNERPFLRVIGDQRGKKAIFSTARLKTAAGIEKTSTCFYGEGDTATIPGFGLGLAIAKTLVDGMDGEIRMESQVGKGSSLIMQFYSAVDG